MCIAEWMTDFIGVVRKEKKRSEVAFKGFRRGRFRERMALNGNNS